jgi:hypothetical protein
MTSARSSMLALLVYAGLSWLLLCHGASLTGTQLGFGPDPGLIMWFLAWWPSCLPWAAAHHVLVLHTHLLWQPVGLNLAWTTNVPLLALLAAPITLSAGPLAAYNLLAIAAPALGAWAAYLLCRGLGATPWAAFCGGLVFGFSSYTAAQSFDHLNLTFTAFVPLAVLVAVRRVRGEAGRPTTVLWLGLLLGGQFLISEEILATFCLFAAIGFCAAYAVEPPRRPILRALVLDIILAAPLALLPAAPILFAMATGVHDIAHPAGWTGFYAIDALNFLLPTESTWLGGRIFAPVSQHFTGALDEQAGYLGLAVLLLLFAVLRDAPLRRVLWLPLVMLGLALLAALGPVLQFGGHITGIPLPWALLVPLPLLGTALPVRCMLYAFLALAIILSVWLSARPEPGSSKGRMLAGFCICLTLLPVPHPAWPSPASLFFRPGRVQQVLGPNPTLLILPFSIEGNSSYWQAENRFGFTQVGGYLGFPPGWAQNDPAVMQLFSGRLLPGFLADFTRLCQLRQVQYVVAGPGTDPALQAALASLPWHAQKTDDVTIYTVPGMP